MFLIWEWRFYFSYRKKFPIWVYIDLSKLGISSIEHTTFGYLWLLLFSNFRSTFFNNWKYFFICDILVRISERELHFIIPLAIAPMHAWPVQHSSPPYITMNSLALWPSTLALYRWSVDCLFGERLWLLTVRVLSNGNIYVLVLHVSDDETDSEWKIDRAAIWNHHRLLL